MTLERAHGAIAWATMAHDDEPGWSDPAKTEREQWLLRPCDACGATYRVWGTQVELLPCCGGTRCKRDRER